MLRKKWNGITISVLFPLIILCSCNSSDYQNTEAENYYKEIINWQKKRLTSLTSKDSWLSLAGLFWLKNGENTFGADESHMIVFPKEKAPPFIGKFILHEGKATVEINTGVKVRSDNDPVTQLELNDDSGGKPTILRNGTLSWYVIKRADDYLIRLKDSENPAIKNFKGIETYPVNSEWRIRARFEPYNPPKKIPVPTVLGNTIHEPCPGALVFEIDDKIYRLDPIAAEEDKTFFIIFSDETSGRDTYGGGRFLSAARPGTDGTTFIDFNKAYNPPCAFTPFATCPLPPEHNHLTVNIAAGEKDYGHSIH